MSEPLLQRGDAVAEAIERAIVAREFEDRLPPERALAERYRVSRGTVREAIGKLVARGLLSRRQGAGTFINDDTDRRTAEIWSDMVERHPRLQESLIEFRTMMECRTAELAATRHTTADRRRLQQVARDVDAAYGASDRRVQIEADVAYHRAIADAAHNPVFSYLMGSLLKPAARPRPAQHCRHAAGHGTVTATACSASGADRRDPVPRLRSSRPCCRPPHGLRASTAQRSAQRGVSRCRGRVRAQRWPDSAGRSLPRPSRAPA